MGRYRLGVLECDGIGPEVVGAAVEVLEAAAEGADGVQLDLEYLPVGLTAITSHGTALPDSTVEALEKCDGWILGPHDSVSYPEAEKAKLNPSGVLRKRFDLYANIRPAKAYAGLPATHPGMDLVVARENTEGFYTDRNMARGLGEFMPTPDMALAVGVITRRATERIARIAFQLARTRRKRVSIVHKANVLRWTTGLFRDVCREVGREFPDVTVDDWHIDAMSALLVRRGREFDVLVTENMFGDILSDLAGELAGSLGMAGSINAGATVAMAQATHGSAPDIAGKGIANPVGMIQSVALLMSWLGERHDDPAVAGIGRRISEAVEVALGDESARTRDLGGRATTREFSARTVMAIQDGR